VAYGVARSRSLVGLFVSTQVLTGVTSESTWWRRRRFSWGALVLSVRLHLTTRTKAIKAGKRATPYGLGLLVSWSRGQYGCTCSHRGPR